MLHAKDHYDLPLFDLPLESSCVMSNVIYDLSTVRDIVRDHAANIKQNQGLTPEQLKELDEHADQPGGLVEFAKPELIWTQDGEHQKKFPSTYMHYPITFADIIEFLELNTKWIKQDDITGSPEFCKEGNNTTKPAMLQLLHDLGDDGDADIIDFDDQFSEEGLKTEIIFSVIVNRTHKTISVVFRGTANTKDIVADANFIPVDHKIIRKVTDNGALVHSGFIKYLCKHTEITDGDSQFNNIVHILLELYRHKDPKLGRDYSDYKLIFSGHSLGGALAQMCAFLVGGHPLSKKDIPSPIEAITYASPVNGDQKYFEAYRKLEKEGRLRHIRISNHNDIIPGNPFIHYVQTGVNIHLYENHVAEVAYKNTKTCISQLSLGSAARHSMYGPGGYYERLYKRDKDGKFLNSHILGESVEDLYKAHAMLDQEDFEEDCTCSPMPK